ncbi:MAG TPA: hypothetical protein VJ715_15430 [Pyrinomonadaceae bacterium]|nr:hypothetical protein [Pyrinomonadaceae bacterium]
MMNPKDAPYYIGLIAGIMIGWLGLRALGVTGIIQFIGALAVGIGVALVAERLHASKG